MSAAVLTAAVKTGVVDEGVDDGTGPGENASIPATSHNGNVLPDVVLARINEELGSSGERVVSALRTAAYLLVLARGDDTGLRLAESAAYNLREAFDGVVAGRPDGDEGFAAVQAAWIRYKLALVGPDADEPAARRELHAVIDRLSADEEHQSYRTQKLLAHLVSQTGVEPLPGQNAPTREYTRLRQQAANTLHSHGTVEDVGALYDDTISWFTRFFTPPDARVTRISALAHQQYEGPAQIDELERLAYNPHHISVFLTEVRDSAWLEPLYDAGLITLPRVGEPWPVNFLVGGAGEISATAIAELLGRLLDATKDCPPETREGFARDIIQTASRLGEAGHSLAAKIVATYPADHWVQMIAVHIARDADPTADVVQVVADAVIGNERTSDGGYYTRTTLEQLAAGLIPANARQRIEMVAAKLRRLSRAKEMRFVTLDTAGLGTPGDDLRDIVLIVAQHFVGMIARWREVGLATDDLIAAVEGIEGEIGERIVCQVLAGASDVDRTTKLGHFAKRLRSNTVTGDDRDLLADLGDLSQQEVADLATAFGTPSPIAEPDEEADTAWLPDDWARAWRWSLILPTGVLEGWEHAISAVSAQHGEPTAAALDTRIPQFLPGRPESPYTAEQLALLPPVEAATLVSTWRPGADDGFWGNSVWELASTFGNVVEADVPAWLADPVAIVDALRQPAYIERYFRAVATSPKDAGVAMPALLRAVTLVREQRSEPARLSRSNIDRDVEWSAVDATIIDVIGKLANNEADLHASNDLDLAWELALDAARAVPADLGSLDDIDTARHDDPLNRAINRPYSKALETALWLGWWEHRNLGQARPALAAALDEALEIQGAVGAEMRAILAAHRHILEHIASQWIQHRGHRLFTGDLGTVALEQTLKWGRPTPRFLGHFQAELAEAATRGVDHAVAWELLGYLWEEPGYDAATLITTHHANTDVLKSAAEEIATLVQDIEPDSPMLHRALQFWDDLLDAGRDAVPAEALVGVGRWTFVDAVDREDWFGRMDRTLQITGGEIEYPVEVGDRCKEAEPSARSLRMLRLMQGHGEPWERGHLAGLAVEALRLASGKGVGTEFNRLRDRLLELGRIDAKDIPPEPT